MALGFLLYPAEDGGAGLPGMRERALQLAGSLEVRSTPGFGTTVLAQIPLTNGQSHK